MKKLLIALLTITATGCGTFQSIVKSNFPYTATLYIPATTKTNTINSATSPASSIDQVFTGQGGNTSYIKEVRIASARIEASNPKSQSMGVFKSIKVFLSNNDGKEQLVASRSDISATIGSSVVLDIDNSKFLDSIVKGRNLKIRMEYELRNQLTIDTSFKAVLGFSTSPDNSNQ